MSGGSGRTRPIGVREHDSTQLCFQDYLSPRQTVYSSRVTSNTHGLHVVYEIDDFPKSRRHSFSNRSTSSLPTAAQRVTGPSRRRAPSKRFQRQCFCQGLAITPLYPSSETTSPDPLQGVSRTTYSRNRWPILPTAFLGSRQPRHKERHLPPG